MFNLTLDLYFDLTVRSGKSMFYCYIFAVRPRNVKIISVSYLTFCFCVIYLLFISFHWHISLDLPQSILFIISPIFVKVLSPLFR